MGGALWPAAERGDDVASHAPAGLDAEQRSWAASERDEQARQAWRQATAQLDPEQLVLVDDSGPNSALPRLYGWAPHDQRAAGSVPRNHGTNPTLVAALAPEGGQVPWMSEGAMDSAPFEWYLREQLAPTLKPGQVVVLDNLSVHNAASIRHALEARHCQLLFLPPYSPDCTPIEQAFSTIKAILRRIGARTKEALWEAMQVAVEAITSEDALAWFALAGYPLSAQAT